MIEYRIAIAIIEELKRKYENTNNEEDKIKKEALEEALNKICSDYLPQHDTYEGLQDAIDYYKTDMVFRLNKTDKEAIDIIIKYLYHLKGARELFSTMCNKFADKSKEQEEQIKCMKQDLRYSIPQSIIRDKINKLKKNKVEGRENKTLNMKIDLLEEIIKNGKGKHTSNLLKMQ